jgi:nitrous oxidase accessory protein NosD
MRALRFAVAFLTLPYDVGLAATWVVCPDGSGDFLTIQAAVDAAAPWDDAIVVCPGNYLEDVLVTDKSIDISSQAGAEETTVRSFSWNGRGGGVTGFTVTASINGTFGSGFRLSDSTVHGPVSLFSDDWEDLDVARCTFFASVDLTQYGGGTPGASDCSLTNADLSVVGAASLSSVRRCVLHNGSLRVENELAIAEDNELVGGGIRIEADNGEFGAGRAVRNTVSGGSVGIDANFSDAELGTVQDNTVVDCAVGIRLRSDLEEELDAERSIARNRISSCETALQIDVTGSGLVSIEENVITGGVDGIRISAATDSVITRNNTIHALVGFGLVYDVPAALVGDATANIITSSGVGVSLPPGADANRFTCNDVWANGTSWVGVPDQDGINGNFACDPRFCGAGAGVFALGANSPCLPGNHPDGADCGRIGAADQGCEAVSATYLVLDDGTGPYRTIQDAIDCSDAGDIIELADGVFTGDGNRDIEFDGKAVTVRSRNGVPGQCVIDCQGSEAERHRGFWFHQGEGPGSVVEGLTITNGFASGSGVQRFGGAIYCDWASPTIAHCVIEQNRAETHGGGINLYQSTAQISGCTIRGNEAEFGGGINSSSSAPVIEDSDIRENHAIDEGGGLRCFDQLNGGPNPKIIGCTIGGNQSELGGGIACLTGDDGCAPTLLACDILENVAGCGGGVYCDGASPTIRGSTIAGNQALGGPGDGAGVSCWNESAPSVVDCLITGNAARSGSGVGGVGGGVSAHANSIPVIEGCTISGNSADSKGGGLYSSDAHPVFLRSIVWGGCAEEGSEAFVSGGEVSFTCSDVDSPGVGGSGLVYYSADDIFVDPRFCGAVSCEESPTLAGDYALNVSSPCLPDQSPCDQLIGALGQGCGTIDLEDSRGGLSITELRILRNPARGTVEFAYTTVGGAGQAIGVFDVRGRLVRTFEPDRATGIIRWDATDESGDPVAPGAYFLRLVAGSQQSTARAVVAR